MPHGSLMNSTKRGIHTCLKHFPGHGSASADSHLGFTDVTGTWSATELQPYIQLIAANAADAVMTGHLYNASIDSMYPATLSQATITGVLRNQLGYSGVVISDEMSMKAISSYYGLDEAMVLAVNAGVDVLLYNKNRDSSGNSLARRVVDVLERSVRDGVIPESRIDASYARIMDLKGVVPTAVSTPATAEVPRDLMLTNYPNPFNPVTTIQYWNPADGQIVLRIVDMLGRTVKIVGRRVSAGRSACRATRWGRACERSLSLPSRNGSRECKPEGRPLALRGREIVRRLKRQMARYTNSDVSDATYIPSPAESMLYPES